MRTISRSWSLAGVLALTIIAVGVACGDSDGGDTDDGGSDTELTEPGTTFELVPGEQFTIVLESNATTGYSWALETDPSPDVIELVADEYVEPDSDLVGAAGAQQLTFEAVGAGETTLELWYVRPFDDPLDPAERARFEVRVADDGS